jgi:hypothetical protein
MSARTNRFFYPRGGTRVPVLTQKPRAMANIASQALMPRDLDTTRIKNLPPCPPDRPSDAVVQKVVRLTGVYNLTMAIPSVIISPTYTSVASQDGVDYLGTAAARYSFIRVDKMVCYVNVAGSHYATSAGLAPIEVTLNDGVSGAAATYTTSLAPGVDWAALGIKLGLSQRFIWQSTGAASSVGSLTVESAGLGAGDAIGGTYVIDLSCSFR